MYRNTVNSRMFQANTIVPGSREPQLYQHQKLEPGGTRPVNLLLSTS